MKLFLRRSALFCSVPLVFLMASCASFHNGAISSGPLLSVNDTKISAAEGYASTYVVIGFGGNGYETMVYSAKRLMEKDYPLKKGEYYSNYTVDFKRTIIFFLIIQNEVYVHADIMSQNPSQIARTPLAPLIKKDSVAEIKPVTQPITKQVTQPMAFYKNKRDSFFLREKIYFNPDAAEPREFKEYEINDLDQYGNVSLKSKTANGKDVVVSAKKIYYSASKARNGIQPGQKIVFRSGSFFAGAEKAGTAIATEAKDFLLVECEGKMYEVLYKEVVK